MIVPFIFAGIDMSYWRCIEDNKNNTLLPLLRLRRYCVAFLKWESYFLLYYYNYLVKVVIVVGHVHKLKIRIGY